MDKGWTPLLAAIEDNQPDIVRLLIEAGADLHLTSLDDTPKHTGYSPLQCLISWALCFPKNLEKMKTQYIELIDLMLKHGANPNFKVSDECAEAANFPLAAVASYSGGKELIAKEIVTLLLHYQANIQLLHEDQQKVILNLVEMNQKTILYPQKNNRLTHRLPKN